MYLVLSLIFISLHRFTSGQEQTYPTPEACTGNCRVHDPSLIRRSSDGAYFLFGSGPNISVKTAPSISGPWTMLPAGLLPKGRIQLGAPDVQQLGPNGSYYLYYQHTVIGTQNSNISWAWSSTLDPGSWKLGGQVDIPRGTAKDNYNRLDPNLLVLHNNNDSNDSNDKALYLSFGSYWDDIFSLRLSSPSNILPGSLAHLAKNVTTYDPHKRNVGANPLEGSYQFAWTHAATNGTETSYYYLFFSSGACCRNASVVPLGDEYKVMVCRALSPQGSFRDALGRSCVSQNGGTMVLRSHGEVYAPGGQGVRFDEVLQRVVMYYHYLNATNGGAPARFGWNYLNFDDNGWPYVTTQSNSTAPPSNYTFASPSSKVTILGTQVASFGFVLLCFVAGLASLGSWIGVI